MSKRWCFYEIAKNSHSFCNRNVSAGLYDDTASLFVNGRLCLSKQAKNELLSCHERALDSAGGGGILDSNWAYFTLEFISERCPALVYYVQAMSVGRTVFMHNKNGALVEVPFETLENVFSSVE